MKRNRQTWRTAMRISGVPTMTIMLAILLAGCVQNVDDLPGGVDDSSFRLRVGVERVTPTAPATRAMAQVLDREDDIYDLTLLWFEYSDDASGAFVTAYTIASDTPPTTIVSDDGVPIDSEFELELGKGLTAALSTKKDYTILAVANGRMYMEGDVVAAMGPITTEADAHAYIFEIGLRHCAPNQLPMSGRTTKAAGQASVELALKRAVARIDIHNAIEDQYEPTSVSLYNPAEQTLLWGDGRIDPMTYHSGARLSVAKPDVALTIPEVGLNGVTDHGTGLEIVAGELAGGIYTLENFESNPDANPASTVSVVVGLRPYSTDALPQYYNIPIHPEDMAQSLMRNHVYRVSIRAINDTGADIESDAIAETGEIDYTINNWDLDDEGLIVTDGQNTMALDSKVIHLDPAGETRIYRIFTMGTGALSITDADLPDGITASLDGNTLTVTATALPDGTASREGTIDLAFGSLRGTVQVIQSPYDDQFIEINRDELPFYPGVGTSGISDSELLRIMSSGDWTATIYNPSSDGTNPGFSFADGSVVLTTDSDTVGETFDIFTTGTNPSTDTRYGFVVFTLKDDPEYSRVLVLRQAGASVILSPNGGSINLDDGSWDGTD